MQGESDRDIYIPSTISEEAKAILKQLSEQAPYKRVFPKVDDKEAWIATQNALEDQLNVNYEAIINADNVNV